MAKKLYVGGLSFNTTEDGLREAFSQAGTVVEDDKEKGCQIIMDRDSNPPRSKGFGFVMMSTDEEAQAAIEMWNGKELDGRTLVVNEARPKEDRPRDGGFGGGYGGGYGGGNSHGGGGGYRGSR